MKSITRYLLPAAGLAAALPALRADEPAGPPDKKEMRVIVSDDGSRPHRRVIRVGDQQEKEVVTYLGVAAVPAQGALADQLNLAKGTGLVVSMVAEGSPAASVLKKNDVLVKLDDQILIEQRQLSVLIRNHQEGDEVTLTYVRGGKESSAKVKLTKNEVPKMAFHDFTPGRRMFNVPYGEDDGPPGMGREDVDRVLSLIDQGPGFHRRLNPGREQPPGMRTTTVNTSNSNMVFSDEQGSLDLTIKDGKKTLIAKNAKGEQVFAGPVTTAEERKALPKEVHDRLDKLEGMQDFSFETDEDFEGGQVHVVKPNKHKIGLLPYDSVPASRPVPTKAPF